MKLSGYKWEENASKIRPINLNTAHILLFEKPPVEYFWIQFGTQWWHEKLNSL